MKNIIKFLGLSLLFISAAASSIYSKELGDEFGGPGIALLNETYDENVINVIYGYGDLNGIVGNEVVEANALSSEGPTGIVGAVNAIIYSDNGPGFIINGFSNTSATEYVDRGPVACDIVVNPSDYLKLITMKPGDFDFFGGTKDDKLKR